MLSDEEKKALKELTEIKELVEEDLKYKDYEVAATLDQIDLESLVIVLNLIEKQSKEIEELKEDNQRYKRIASQKLDDIEEFRKNECEHRCIRNAEVLELKEYYQENYTPNDKIKAKIEELENQKKQWIEDRDNKHKDSEIIYAIEVLQSLLEKE